MIFNRFCFAVGRCLHYLWVVIESFWISCCSWTSRRLLCAGNLALGLTQVNYLSLINVCNSIDHFAKHLIFNSQVRLQGSLKFSDPRRSMETFQLSQIHWFPVDSSNGKWVRNVKSNVYYLFFSQPSTFAVVSPFLNGRVGLDTFVILRRFPFLSRPNFRLLFAKCSGAAQIDRLCNDIYIWCTIVVIFLRLTKLPVVSCDDISANAEFFFLSRPVAVTLFGVDFLIWPLQCDSRECACYVRLNVTCLGMIPLRGCKATRGWLILFCKTLPSKRPCTFYWRSEVIRKNLCWSKLWSFFPIGSIQLHTEGWSNFFTFPCEQDF